MRVEEFVLEILEGSIIELKLPLQRSICHTLALAQEVNHVIKEGIKVHLVSSLGLPSQTRVPVLAHLICASMYHSRGRKERGKCAIGWRDRAEPGRSRHTPDPPALPA